MNTGCIRCTVRGDLIAGLKKLIMSTDNIGKQLDGVMTETTCLAVPQPMAQPFFADDFVQQHMRLDGILSLVDAAHFSSFSTTGSQRAKRTRQLSRSLSQTASCWWAASLLAEVERRIRLMNKKVQSRAPCTAR